MEERHISAWLMQEQSFYERARGWLIFRVARVLYCADRGGWGEKGGEEGIAGDGRVLLFESSSHFSTREVY